MAQADSVAQAGSVRRVTTGAVNVRLKADRQLGWFMEQAFYSLVVFILRTAFPAFLVKLEVRSSKRLHITTVTGNRTTPARRTAYHGRDVSRRAASKAKPNVSPNT